jgi:WD40 repeat protein
MLASAGDDGNIILWVPAEPNHRHAPGFGDDDLEDKETWRLKHMCRSMGSEIYDIAWSPDGMFFITGSMDNIARVWNAQTGREYLLVRCFQCAEICGLRRPDGSSDRRAQPLCARRRLGSTQ